MFVPYPAPLSAWRSPLRSAQLTIVALCLLMPAWHRSLASDGPNDPPPQRAITRLFFQDPDQLTLLWGDLLASNPPTLSPLQPVEGFPQLDPARQSLVQMITASGKVLLGVRDDEDGEFQSGWVLVDSGVEEEDHGDHSHWYYTSAPRVIASQLDDAQGNPAHLYCYDGVFYVANDRIGGFTRLDPAAIAADADEAAIRSLASFHVGGNGHITLAVAGELAFATWMSREEEHARRIDVTALTSGGSKQIAYAFNANSDRLHGATTQSGKVFFAPADGIDWITAPASAEVPASDLVVHHLDLGSMDETPLRTGSFLTHAGHVLFLSGAGERSFLGVIDARPAVPGLTRVSLDVDPASRASAPFAVATRAFGPLVFAFHDHPQDTDAPNLASVIALDPDRNGDYSDAKLLREIEVGSSAVEGHGGHHDMVADAAGRFAVISSPGDSTLQMLSLLDLSTLSSTTLSFVPARMVAVGGRGPIR